MTSARRSCSYDAVTHGVHQRPARRGFSRGTRSADICPGLPSRPTSVCEGPRQPRCMLTPRRTPVNQKRKRPSAGRNGRAGTGRDSAPGAGGTTEAQPSGTGCVKGASELQSRANSPGGVRRIRRPTLEVRAVAEFCLRPVAYAAIRVDQRGTVSAARQWSAHPLETATPPCLARDSGFRRRRFRASVGRERLSPARFTRQRLLTQGVPGLLRACG